MHGPTTSSPAGTSFPTRSGKACSRSGTAALASGAASCSAAPPAHLSSAAPGQAYARCSTRPHPGCCSRKGSADWWNQELFGKPTRLPWALKISPAHRPPGYSQYATFHPTFLYESLWDLLCVGLLLWIDRRFALRRPALFALYVSFYTAFRAYEETLRIDLGSHYYLGFRLNFYVSIGVFIAATAFFVWWQFIRPQPEGATRTIDLPQQT